MSVSVVVASNRESTLLHACIASLVPQCRASGAQLIVVRAGALQAEDAARVTGSGATLVRAPDAATIPILRGLGMQVATGDLVAVTEDHCLAAPDWLDSIRVGATDGVDVLGGGMDNAQRARSVDWGAFFSEYGFFSSERPTSTEVPALLTGANVAYARTVSAAVASWAVAGEWENVIHNRLAHSGFVLRFAPRAVILQNKTYAFGPFAVDRFEHGVDYARTRLTVEGVGRRWIRLLLTPALPWVLTARVARAAASGRWLTFVFALPATFAFLAAWSLGEAVGYLRGPSRVGGAHSLPVTSDGSP